MGRAADQALVNIQNLTEPHSRSVDRRRHPRRRPFCPRGLATPERAWERSTIACGATRRPTARPSSRERARCPRFCPAGISTINSGALLRIPDSSFNGQLGGRSEQGRHAVPRDARLGHLGVDCRDRCSRARGAGAVAMASASRDVLGLVARLESTVHALRTEVGLHDHEIATAVGVSRRTVRRWASAQTSPQPRNAEGLDDLCAIIAVLGHQRDRSAVRDWLRRRNPVLAWARPLDRLGRGDFQGVLAAAQQVSAEPSPPAEGG